MISGYKSGNIPHLTKLHIHYYRILLMLELEFL
jgi:hypothetical protein